MGVFIRLTPFPREFFQKTHKGFHADGFDFLSATAHQPGRKEIRQA